MQLFELVSPRLFRPLAGPNRAFYAELLLLLWEECRHTADYSISRAEAVSRAEDYFAALAKPLALDADDAGDEAEQPTRDPHTLALGFLLRLRRTGWLEEQPGSYEGEASLAFVPEVTPLLEALEEMMGQEHRFGSAGSRVVIEEFMEGEECSLLCFTDGKTIVPMIPAQDHKRVFDGDKGPNTGGMGAYAPAPVMTEALKQKTLDTIIRPVIDALEKEGRPYSGCLYAGLMISGDSIKVVEFNCRFGDPETQAVLPLFDGDLAEVMYACATGTLRPDMVKWKSGAAVCVVMASGGYPGSYPKGIAITGLEEASKLEDVVVFHAGTKEVDGQIVTNGGRVLGVTAVDETIAKAKERAYGAVERIHFEGAQYRKDIAWRALNR